VLPDTNDITLGRKQGENDIPLKGATASRHHAIIRNQGGAYTIFNLRPDNPIFVNGNPVTQQCVLAPGDTVQAGESVFQFDLQA
jgi:pSer/pThr/pTyr-binding forkhead associated (FHA) protein